MAGDDVVQKNSRRHRKDSRKDEVGLSVQARDALGLGFLPSVVLRLLRLVVGGLRLILIGHDRI